MKNKKGLNRKICKNSCKKDCWWNRVSKMPASELILVPKDSFCIKNHQTGKIRQYSIRTIWKHVPIPKNCPFYLEHIIWNQK